MVLGDFMWLMRNGPTLAELFRVLRGKNPSITDARAQCQIARRKFLEALKQRDAAWVAEEKASKESGDIRNLSESVQRAISEMNATEKAEAAKAAQRAYLEAARAVETAEAALHQAKRKYDRALARL